MRVAFNLEKHAEVFDKLVTELGYSPEIFDTDDVIEIDWLEFESIKDELPNVAFVVDGDSLTLRERLFKAADMLGWIVAVDENGGVDFRQGSPAGEAFSFYVHPDEDIVEETISYASNFDVDEHIEMWVEAKRNGVAGVPSTRTLVEDADDIAEMLEKLAEAFATVRRDFYADPKETSDDVECEARDNGCTKILVVVKGGMVQEVYCTDMNAEVCIEDLDTIENEKDDDSGFWIDGSPINKNNLTQLY